MIWRMLNSWAGVLEDIGVDTGGPALKVGLLPDQNLRLQADEKLLIGWYDRGRRLKRWIVLG